MLSIVSILLRKKFIVATAVVLIVLFFSSMMTSEPEFELQMKDLKTIKMDRQKIFIVETSGMDNATLGNLRSRQSCSIESAALVNPDADIFVVFTNMEKLIVSKFIAALRKYRNIFFVQINVEELAKNSPFEEFIQSKRMDASMWPKEHYSDLLRLLLLWK